MSIPQLGSPTKSLEWEALESHKSKIENFNLRVAFSENKNRFKDFSLQFNESLLFDYSKNLLNKETIKLLVDYAHSRKLPEMIQAAQSGEKINFTEKRAVLHTALRSQDNKPIFLDNNDVMPEITRVLNKMKTFSEAIRTGTWIGHTNKKIEHVVNIGIGGSDLGPKMAYEALKKYVNGPQVTFVSNVDGTDIHEALKSLNPETTLFLIASKTFTTQETMTNANTAKKWLIDALGQSAVCKHFVAMSTNIEKVSSFGIDTQNMFEFWDFVGGRYSVWSAIGLSLSIAIGFDNFKEFLTGAYEVDKHFLETPIEQNIPALMGLIGFWYNNFHNSSSYAILPYDQYLHRFPAYLQQGDMESNGKYIDRNGCEVDYQTGPIIWGEPGTNGQHAFYQLIHQGTKLIPADFIGFAQSLNDSGEHHKILLSHLFAQTGALAFGLNEKEVEQTLKDSGLSNEAIKLLKPHKVFKGNRPTNTLLFKELTPKTLGSLISLYEHKIFTQGVLWNVNSFDQWGVELGKVLAKNIYIDINQKHARQKDSSTNGLLNYYFSNSN